MAYPKKSLGQNYLIDKNIIKKIVNLTNVKNKNIIEIGPGLGALTDEILKKKPKSLKAIEKDYFLAKKLNEKYINNKIIKILNQDILKLELKNIINKNTIIFGNLPYNISSQIFVKIIRICQWPTNITDIILMFQKELAEKIKCKFPSMHYGRLSILNQYRLSVIKNFLVSPNCFFPKPKVTSMVLHFKPKKSNIEIKDIKNLEKITNLLFSNKRKMINKNIKRILSPNQIKQVKDLNLSHRPSDIKPKTFFEITRLFEI